MAARIKLRILSRVWGTLREPRAVTACTIAAYTALLVLAVRVVQTDSDRDLPTILISVALIVSTMVGGMSAWRGFWAVEGPAAVVTGGSLITLGVMSVYDPMLSEDWPGALGVVIGPLFAALHVGDQWLTVATSLVGAMGVVSSTLSRAHLDAEETAPAGTTLPASADAPPVETEAASSADTGVDAILAAQEDAADAVTETQAYVGAAASDTPTVATATTMSTIAGA